MRSTAARSPTRSCEKVQANGGVMTRADLAEFEPEWVEPISTNYHGYDVFQLPPPGQGFAALEMLNILEVCVPKLGLNLAHARARRSDVLAPDGRGEEARLRRPARQERRSEVRDRCRSRSCSRSRTPRTLCDRIDPERGLEAGRARRHRWRDDLPDHRRSLGQHGVAHSQRVQRLRQPRDGRAVRLRAAQPRRRLLARPAAARTSSRRASGRSTRSSPAS